MSSEIKLPSNKSKISAPGARTSTCSPTLTYKLWQRCVTIEEVLQEVPGHIPGNFRWIYANSSLTMFSRTLFCHEKMVYSVFIKEQRKRKNYFYLINLLIILAKFSFINANIVRGNPALYFFSKMLNNI